MPILTCPCFSGKPYADCCKPYHEGINAESPLKLMRSRYSAYALGLADYIQKTTHPDSPHHEREKEAILHFCKTTRFVGLEILDARDNEVTFFAKLKSLRGEDISFKERSMFEKVDGIWLYVDRA